MEGNDQNEVPAQGVESDVKAANTSVVLCVWVGMGAGLVAAWGEGFWMGVMGVVYGMVVGGCAYVFVLCVMFLVSLVLPGRGGKVEGVLTRLCLLGAPVFAGWVVYVTGVRLF